MFLDKINDGFWACKHTWAKSANNTKWCLIGCATGEFATLAYFSYSGITSDLVLYSTVWYLFAALPLINGLITSVILETIILIRSNFDFANALKTALGMSFISMLMMEVAMMFTDSGFYRRRLGPKLFCDPFNAFSRFFSALAL